MQTEAYFQFTFIWLHSFICRAQCEIKISSCVTWRDGCVDACQNIAQMDNLIFRSLQIILKYLDESKSYCDWSKVETGFGYHHYGAHCEQIDANAVFWLFNCSWYCRITSDERLRSCTNMQTIISLIFALVDRITDSCRHVRLLLLGIISLTLLSCILSVFHFEQVDVAGKASNTIYQSKWLKSANNLQPLHLYRPNQQFRF